MKRRLRLPSNSWQLTVMGGVWIILGAGLGDGDARGPLATGLGMLCIVASYICDSIEKSSHRS